MPSENKPNVNTIWASTGEATAVPPAKQALGYVEEIPFYDDFNGHMQQLSQFQKHCNQEGIPVWDTDTPYFVGGSAKSPVDKNVYRAVSDNTGVPPILVVGGLVNAAWVRWSYTLPELMDAVSKVFVGSIAAFAAYPDTGWLLCDGGEYSRTTYATLFNRVGFQYGVGNGTTTFNVPDLRGEQIRGLDMGRGVDPGRTLGSYQAQQVPEHYHSALATGFGDSAVGAGNIATTQVAGTAVAAGTAALPNTMTSGVYGIAKGVENRVRNIAMPYFIKY